MAGIIKAGQPTQGGRAIGGVAFNFDDMTGQAGLYLDQVRSEAVKIIAEAKTQAARLRDQAAEQGRRAAVEAARKSLQAEIETRLQTLTPALQQAAAELLQTKEQWQSHWEKNVLQLAIAIAERIIRREVARQPEITLQWIREAIELASRGGRLRLLLNPTDHETLGGAARDIVAAVRDISTVEVAADQSVSPGGCVVKTEFGAIDQQIESQLSRIAEELK